MVSASISGLASGLDTATIISQLMQLEAMPQTRLKAQITTHQSALGKLQDLNSKIAALATRASDLTLGSAWSPILATSSYDKVSITTTSGAQPTSLSFTVVATAAAHTISFNNSALLTDVVVNNPSKDIKLDMLDGNVYTINTGDGTLSSVVSAINGSGHDLRASTVQLNDGTYRLRVESATTGAASDFDIGSAQGQPLLGGTTVVTAGADAAITIGPDTIKSSTNTFTNVLPGVNLTLGFDAVAGTAVTATLSTDAKKMTETVKALVDALNSALGAIDAATQNASGSVKAGALAGDTSLRRVRDQLVDTLYSAAGDSLSTVGIQLDKSGKFVFDEAKFTTAYLANPTGTTKFTSSITPGFTDRLATVAKQASRASDGTISAMITGRQSLIDRLQDGVESWNQRLVLRQATLTRQFTALETALSRMNSQSNWLAGQIASLPTG